MEDNDVILSQCPSCKFQQLFNFLEYNKVGECIICEKCHTPYKINKGIVYGIKMTDLEYKEWKFITKLRTNS